MSTATLGLQGTTAFSYSAYLGMIAVVSPAPQFYRDRVAEEIRAAVYLDNSKLLNLAGRSRPAQSWYAEDFEGLY